MLNVSHNFVRQSLLLGSQQNHFTNIWDLSLTVDGQSRHLSASEEGRRVKL